MASNDKRDHLSRCQPEPLSAGGLGDPALSVMMAWASRRLSANTWMKHLFFFKARFKPSQGGTFFKAYLCFHKFGKEKTNGTSNSCLLVPSEVLGKTCCTPVLLQISSWRNSGIQRDTKPQSIPGQNTCATIAPSSLIMENDWPARLQPKRIIKIQKWETNIFSHSLTSCTLLSTTTL